MLSTRSVGLIFSTTVIVLGAATASAQSYPNKPIRIVTSEAGASTDNTARIVGQGISGLVGQPVIIDNRGSGMITGDLVAHAAPDGYTLLVQGSAVWVATLFRKTPYDPIKDFSPITQLVTAPQILCVNSSVPVKSVKELIDLAKARPGSLNYASGLPGTLNHLAAELLKSMAGVNIVGISYKGGAPALNSLLSGETQIMFVAMSSAAPHLKSGRIRALGATTPQTSALAPGIPTLAATLPGYESASVVGFLAPAKTPATIINRLNQEAVRVLNTAEVKEKFSSIGIETVGNSPAQFGASIKSEMARLGKVIKEAGLRAE